MPIDVVKATEGMLTPELQEIARFIQSKIPAGWGFGVMIFPFNVDPDDGMLLWASNARREDMIENMKEFIRKNGGEP